MLIIVACGPICDVVPCHSCAARPFPAGRKARSDRPRGHKEVHGGRTSMRTTGWMRRKKFAAASVTAVTAVALAAGQAGPAVAADNLARATARPSALKKTPDFKLTKPMQRTGTVPGTLIAVLSDASVTGRRLRPGSTLRAPKTSDTALNRTLFRLGATSIEPLFSRLSPAAARALTSAARQRIGSNALNLGDIVVVHVTKGSAAAAARKLAGTDGISFAEPDRYVETMDTGGPALTAAATGTPLRAAARSLIAADVRAATPGSSLLPTNYG